MRIQHRLESLRCHLKAIPILPSSQGKVDTLDVPLVARKCNLTIHLKIELDIDCSTSCSSDKCRCQVKRSAH